MLSLGASMRRFRAGRGNRSAMEFLEATVILRAAAERSEVGDVVEGDPDTFLGLVEADKGTRNPAPLSKLCVGLKCGGSDGFSGISANPAIGHTADILAALGGRTILSEFPELCGVEQGLIDRRKKKEVGDDYSTDARLCGAGEGGAFRI